MKNKAINQTKKTLSKTLIYEGTQELDLLEAHVVWADGLGDTARECNICETQTCVKPTHTEAYKIISDKLAHEWDIENPVV